MPPLAHRPKQAPPTLAVNARKYDNNAATHPATIKPTLQRPRPRQYQKPLRDTGTSWSTQWRPRLLLRLKFGKGSHTHTRTFADGVARATDCAPTPPCRGLGCAMRCLQPHLQDSSSQPRLHGHGPATPQMPGSGRGTRPPRQIGARSPPVCFIARSCPKGRVQSVDLRAWRGMRGARATGVGWERFRGGKRFFPFFPTIAFLPK